MKVTSQKELMAEQARSAVRISGAHHSSWNGRLAVTAPNRKVRGAVKWDNTIEYSDPLVNEPLREMFANARVHNQDAETLRSYREAVKTVLHENTHVLSAEGSDHSDARNAFQHTPGARPLEEGVTELYSYNNLNAYIDDLGLEEIAPGISTAEARQSYPQFTPAAQRFTDAIGRRAVIDGDEVVRNLAVVNAAQKFRVAAEMLYDNSDLPALVPDQERDAAVRRIETAMQEPLANLGDLDTSDKDRLRRESAQAGASAARAGVNEMKAIRAQWTAPQPGQRVERGPQQQTNQQPRNNPQQARGGPQRVQEAVRAQQAVQVAGPMRGEQSQGSRAAPGGQERGGQAVRVGGQSGTGGQQAAQSGELQQAMRAGLSGATPMSSARPLAPGEQGARPGGAQAGQERQGPERGE